MECRRQKNKEIEGERENRRYAKKDREQSNFLTQKKKKLKGRKCIKRKTEKY